MRDPSTLNQKKSEPEVNLPLLLPPGICKNVCLESERTGGKKSSKLDNEVSSTGDPCEELQPKLTSLGCPRRPQVMNIVVPSDTRLLVPFSPRQNKSKSSLEEVTFILDHQGIFTNKSSGAPTNRPLKSNQAHKEIRHHEQKTAEIDFRCCGHLVYIYTHFL